MQSNFFTFGQRYATKNHYVEIVSDSPEIARAAMADHFVDKWAFQYREEKFQEAIGEFNLKLLIKITVVDHGHGSLEYIAN